MCSKGGDGHGGDGKSGHDEGGCSIGRDCGMTGGRSGACGLSVGVRGSAGEELRLVAIDMKGIVHIANITIPSTGDIEVSM